MQKGLRNWLSVLVARVDEKLKSDWSGELTQPGKAYTQHNTYRKLNEIFEKQKNLSEQQNDKNVCKDNSSNSRAKSNGKKYLGKQNIEHKTYLAE